MNTIGGDPSAASQDAGRPNASPSGSVPVMWMNSADDFINPPDLGIAEQEVKRLKNGKFILIPASEQTHGHGTHTFAVIWKDRLAELLQRSAR